MIVLADAATDVALAALSLAHDLVQAGAKAVAHDLMVAVDNDIQAGKVLKTLTVRDSRLYYGVQCLGEIP